jgi:hypothetical protein
LDITRNEFNKSKFRIVLFDKNEADVTVDFSEYNFSKGTYYTIKDVEKHNKILKSGKLRNDKKVVFSMKLNKNDKNKTLDNFRIYIIEIDKPRT